MPYLNIKESKIVNSIALQVGGLEGLVESKILKVTSDIFMRLTQEGSLDNEYIDRLEKTKDNVERTINGISRKTLQLRKIPSRLRQSTSTLKNLINTILTVPVPQAVPPGVGLPIGVTTRYADQLHTLKEKLKQLEDDADAIEKLIEKLEVLLNKAKNAIKELDIILVLSKLEGIITNTLPYSDKLENFLLREGIVKTSNTLGLLGIRPNLIGLTDKEKSRELEKKSNFLVDFLRKINDSNIEEELKSRLGRELIPFRVETQGKEEPLVYPYKEYVIRVEVDNTSPAIAFRHFAIAVDKYGTVVAKGEPSFTSNVDLLVEELKLKIESTLL